MKILFAILLCLCLTSCGDTPAAETAAPAPPTTVPSVPPETTVPETEPPIDPVEEILNALTLDEQVGQLFLGRCEDSTARDDIETYHLGGLVLFGQDFEGQTPDSMKNKLAGYQAASRVPLLLAVDEEGGTVTRISRYPAFRDAPLPSPRDAYSQGGLDQALINEEEKCILLSSLGMNVNLGPVCDIAIDPSAFMYKRSIGLGPEDTGEFVRRTVGLMNAYRVGSALKHFPGYGSNSDTHTGIARDNRSLAELERRDLVPFNAGIQAGCGAILVSHTIVEALDGSCPASLSPAVHRYLREEMHFDGVILTDDLVMEAITDLYGAGDAAVLAVQAGNDLLCSTDYRTQYEAALAAVKDGRIDPAQIQSAARRVLKWKMDLGLLRDPLPKAQPKDSDLVNVSDYIPNITVELRYAGPDNFTGQTIYDFHDAYLRYGTVKKLAVAADALKIKGYSLKIWDAFRPVSAQYTLWTVCPDGNFVANPNTGYSSHSRGNTLDITLVDENGVEVLMPSAFDDFSPLADRNYSDCSDMAAGNAMLLQETMEKYGFQGYYNEWWHFSDTTDYPVEEHFQP